MTTEEAVNLAATNKDCREYLDRLKRKTGKTDNQLCQEEIVKAVFNEYEKGVNRDNGRRS